LRAALLVLCGVLAVSCADHRRTALEEAKAKYDFMAKNGASPPDLCAQAAKIADMAADIRDQNEFRFWNLELRDCRK